MVPQVGDGVVGKRLGEVGSDERCGGGGGEGFVGEPMECTVQEVARGKGQQVLEGDVIGVGAGAGGSDG